MFEQKIFKTTLICVSVFVLIFISLFRTSNRGFHNNLFTNSRAVFFEPTSNNHVSAPSVIFTLPQSGALGIGNQLFLYACSYAVARSNGIPLYLHCPKDHCQNGGNFSDNSRSFNPSSREFALDKFNIPMVNFVDETVVDTLVKNITYFSDQDILEKSYKVVASTFLKHQENLCQSHEYWCGYEDEIRSMFQIKPDSIRLEKLATIRKWIATSESVAVHVRRGDFLGGSHPPLSMQRRAIRKLERILRKDKVQPTYFVFSDDYKYTKEKLRDLQIQFNLTFVVDTISDTTSLEDLLLMTECKHIIFQDSTFSWWAAWLNGNPNKIVITSSFHPNLFWDCFKARNGDFYWTLYGMMYHPKQWIVLNPFTGGI